MVDVSTDVYVLLVQVMKEQCSWLRESCQIPHWEEVEKHDMHQCSHSRREIGGE